MKINLIAWEMTYMIKSNVLNGIDVLLMQRVTVSPLLVNIN